MNIKKLDTYKHLLSLYGKGKRLLDVATGHGIYAVVAALSGYDVTAFDARIDRIPVYYPNINWLVENLKDFDYRGYTTINCLGILYHLPIHEQIILLKKINYTTVILDTHYSDKIIDKQDGFFGKVYIEAKDIQNLKGRPLAAFDELKAFWHTEPSLYTLFGKCGLKVSQTAVITNNRNFYVLEPK